MACDDMLTMILLFREKSVYLWQKPLEEDTGRRSIAAATPMMTKKYEPGYSNNRRSLLIQENSRKKEYENELDYNHCLQPDCMDLNDSNQSIHRYKSRK